MQESPDFGFQLLRMVGSLGLVLGLLLASLYGLKRWGQWIKRSGGNSLIQVLAQHSFGPKHYLLLVRVQDQLLVGISPQGMHLLTTLPPVRENAPNQEGSQNTQ